MRIVYGIAVGVVLTAWVLVWGTLIASAWAYDRARGKMRRA